ncbi:MAG: 2,3-bisphosphoglycerate-independent phosphoglycerate mutase [Natronincolaceae bacterium]|jgi:2,3-bisphosphoglycerate-independent phosphoglycerate mutase|nr:2,3-bisphosphoglycerate-independent phosphoglycerate mutase [Bacillota bacterium]NLK90311.1 2,3-bisphosphoglycerate-independent phosphoglycerate mutase [Clostridiales bacterium]
MKKPVALIILDGLGIRENKFGNAVKIADLPNYNSLLKNYPNTQVLASGEDVGLPKGQMGNSEVGHLNIGAGRIVYQDLTRITREIESGNFYKNPKFLEVISHVENNGRKLHLMGLVSDGGVHSHIEHLFALIKLAKQQGLDEVYIHCFLDGRDTPPRSAKGFIDALENKMGEIGIGRIATISGRYYAMDRDKRWNRTKLAYDAMVLGRGKIATDAISAIDVSYASGKNDEFVLPAVILNSGGGYDRIEKDDGIIFFNFRPDRARQMTRALVDIDFDHFERENGYFPLHFVTMTVYDKTIGNVEVAYEPIELENTLGDYVSKKGLNQLRIAETEKYAHVTFFFNGGIETPSPNEDRILIPSPEVATYDLQPEMSAIELTEKLLEKIDEDKYDLIIVNYANPDMVGHTGCLDAVVKALETVDRCIDKVINKILAKGGSAIVTSDHGNSECMINEQCNTPITSHTTNPVPLILIGAGDVKLNQGGRLSDIAPTLLQLLGLEKPKEMTGNSLIQR